MTTITISRQFASSGDEIATRVCELLGYHRFDKSLIAQASVDSGLAEGELVDFTEDDYKIRNFLDRLLGRTPMIVQSYTWQADPTAVRTPHATSIREDTALALVQHAIWNAYKQGSVVIVGRGGQAVLQEQPDVIHVRIEAPLEARIQYVKQVLRSSESHFMSSVELRRRAQDLVAERDQASTDYLEHYYHVNWADPQLYHVVFNTGKVSVEQAAQAIAAMVTCKPE